MFNWLSLDVPGARVLDCFAGAGGLGLEAASRGSTKVTLVDNDRAITDNLKKNSERLKAENVDIVTQDVLRYLKADTEKYDLVFIDPPYQLSSLRDEVISLLIGRDLLKSDAKIYIEWPAEQEMMLNHDKLDWIKQKSAASVCYGVAQWGDSG